MPTDFETLYEEHRDLLYRALVLVTDDRDLSLEAVDRGFARLSRKSLRTATSPEAEVLRRALRTVRRADRSHGMRGFRLPDAATSPETDAVVSALHRLDLDARLAVVASSFLEWDDQDVARVLGRADAAAVTADGIATVASELSVPEDAAPDHIASALAAAAGALSRPLSRLESVRTEGRLARLGTAAAAAAVVLVAVGGTALGVGWLRGTAETDVTAPAAGATGTSQGSGTPGTVTTATVAALPEDIEWVQTGLPFRQGEISTATAGPNGFVAIGQDYSDPNGSLRLLLSETGYDWTVVDAPLPRNGWVNTLVYEGGRYFGVGSSYDELSGRDTPTVITSEDGVAWEALTVPVSPTAEVAGTSVRVYTNVTSVTGSGDDIIVIGTQNAEEDLSRLFRDALPEDLQGNQNWGIGPNGIEFYDFDGSLIRTVTPDELNIDPGLFQLLSTGRPVAWRSSDGGATWEEESLGGSNGPDGWLGQVAVHNDTVVALAYGQFGGSLWSSAGGEWQPVDLGRGATVTALARHGDGFLAAGSDGAKGVMWRSTDGATWTASGDQALAGIQIDRLAIGAFGVLAVGQDMGSAVTIGPAVVESAEGLIVEIDSTGRFVVTDADGAVILEVFGNEVTYGREGGVELMDPDTGEVVATLDQRDIDLAWEVVYRELEGQGEFGGQFPTWAMAVSRNGEAWTRVNADAFGQGFYPNVVALGADRILVTGWVEGDVIEPGPKAWVGEF